MKHPFLQLPSSVKDKASSNKLRNSQSSLGSYEDERVSSRVWSQPLLQERGDRDPNGSFAATALVSYDGRTSDADNRTTADDCINDSMEDGRRQQQQHGVEVGGSSEEEEEEEEEEGGGDSTCTSELRPQRLQFRPEKQPSFEGKLPRGGGGGGAVHQHQRQHQRHPPAPPTAHSSVLSPPHLSTSAHVSPGEGRVMSGEGVDSSLLVSPAYYSQRPQSRSQPQPHRQSYPSPSHHSHSHHDATSPVARLGSPSHASRPLPRNGHLLINARSPGGHDQSLALSLDSSLHCGGLSRASSFQNCNGFGAHTTNSSMSSADFEFSSRNNSLLHSVSSSGRRSSSRAAAATGNGSSRGRDRSRVAVSPEAGSRPGAATGRRLWVPRPSSGGGGQSSPGSSPGQQEFCYCAPRGDVLIVSKGGDVVYLTYLLDKSNKLRPCRLSVRATNPLKLLLGKVNKDMCQEIRDIRAASMRGSAFSLASEESGEGEGEGTDMGEHLLDRGNGGGFIGKESFPDQTLEILSDTLWITSYHITKLPYALKKTYATVARMLDAVKCKLPKLILYLTDNDDSVSNKSHPTTTTTNETQHTSTTNSNEKKAICKCMIMCNDPLPDFSVRWADGTKLRYCLSDGKLHITNNQGSSEDRYRWEGFTSTDTDWATSAPKSIRKYLLLAQSAMRRCLAEDMKHQQSVDDSIAAAACCAAAAGSDVEESLPTKRRGAAAVMKYPIIVVESIANT
jgi:hypothetical protein